MNDPDFQISSVTGITFTAAYIRIMPSPFRTGNRYIFPERIHHSLFTDHRRSFFLLYFVHQKSRYVDMIKIDQNKCIGCRKCIMDCPCYCLVIIDGKARFKDPSPGCIQCGLRFSFVRRVITLSEFSQLFRVDRSALSLCFNDITFQYSNANASCCYLYKSLHKFTLQLFSLFFRQLPFLPFIEFICIRHSWKTYCYRTVRDGSLYRTPRLISFYRQKVIYGGIHITSFLKLRFLGWMM